MADTRKPFDYVQIVVDDDWGLVGIVPPGNAGDRAKKLVNKFPLQNSTQTQSKIEIQQESQVIKQPPRNSLSITPEATIVNRRRPVTKILNKPFVNDDFTSLVTPADSTNITDSISRSNPHSLTGLSQTGSERNNIFPSVTMVPNLTQMHPTNSDIAKQSLSLSGQGTNVKRRDNVLVGYRSS